jgi:uncharacterized protein (TIGR00266 family)
MPRQCDELDYRLVGDDLQAVVVTLDPNEQVIAEAGSMLYMMDGVEMQTEMATDAKQGLFGGLMKAAGRVLTGESFFITTFSNGGANRAEVAFAAPFPGKILAVDLAEHGGRLTCQKDSFLCAARGTEIAVAFQKKLGVGIFGGEGFILQRLVGDGLAFIHAGGTLIEHTLKAGERLRVDAGCVAAFDDTVQYDIQFVGGFKNALFGGEGLFFANLTGPGRVYLQTLPFSRMSDRIVSAASHLTHRSRDDGNFLSGFLKSS